jgi:hypothetical protein
MSFEIMPTVWAMSHTGLTQFCGSWHYCYFQAIVTRANFLSFPFNYACLLMISDSSSVPGHYDTNEFEYRNKPAVPGTTLRKNSVHDCQFFKHCVTSLFNVNLSWSATTYNTSGLFRLHRCWSLHLLPIESLFTHRLGNARIVCS